MPNTPKTPHPVEYIRTAYFTDTSKDKVIDDYAKDSIKKKSTTNNSTNSTKKVVKELNSTEDFKDKKTNTSTDIDTKVEVREKIDYMPSDGVVVVGFD